MLAFDLLPPVYCLHATYRLQHVTRHFRVTYGHMLFTYNLLAAYCQLPNSLLHSLTELTAANSLRSSAQHQPDVLETVEYRMPTCAP